MDDRSGRRDGLHEVLGRSPDAGGGGGGDGRPYGRRERRRASDAVVDAAPRGCARRPGRPGDCRPGAGRRTDGHDLHQQYRADHVRYFIGYLRLGPYAQQFETGGNPAGYSLSEIVVKIQMGTSGVTPRFALHNSTTQGASDEPGTKVVDLSGSVATAGEQSFTPASPTTLSASTKYFVVFKTQTSSQTASLARTSFDDHDSGASAGWEIADGSVVSYNSGTSWQSGGGISIQIAVKGTTNNNPPTVANAIPGPDGDGWVALLLPVPDEHVHRCQHGGHADLHGDEGRRRRHFRHG